MEKGALSRRLPPSRAQQTSGASPAMLRDIAAAAGCT
jgi:hypothetical protein